MYDPTQDAVKLELAESRLGGERAGTPVSHEARPTFIFCGTKMFHWELVDPEGRPLGISAHRWENRKEAWVAMMTARARAAILAGFQLHRTELPDGQIRAWWELSGASGVLATGGMCLDEEAVEAELKEFVTAAVVARVHDETLAGGVPALDSVDEAPPPTSCDHPALALQSQLGGAHGHDVTRSVLGRA